MARARNAAQAPPAADVAGIGLAVAIAIDATLVRCLLVPAVMTLLGRAAWWMPRRMERWTPRISIEGDGQPDVLRGGQP